VVITLTTIGYGDFSPSTPVTKLITIFYGLNGVMLLLMLFDVIRQVRGWTITPGGEKETVRNNNQTLMAQGMQKSAKYIIFQNKGEK